MIDYLGLFVIVGWALGVWAFWDVFRARSGMVRTCVWALILLIPFVGFVAWFLIGPRAAKAK